MLQRTSIGWDVHALSVVACAIDGQTGDMFKQRLCPDHGEILGWLRSLPGPVKVVYEAGPTGFGLCRFLSRAGMECVVVAPSKLQRPAGDRVKTDTRDALHLARLLRLGEVVEVTVPSVEQEAARDLVRAREDARGDLMRCRHRLSKLLLRQGIVYLGGAAWTGAHDMWLRSQRFDQSALQATFDSNYEAMLLTRGRRDRLDAAIEEMAENSPYTPMVHRLGCLRGVSRWPGSGWRSRSATGNASQGARSARTPGWCRVNTPRGHHDRRVRSPRPAMVMHVGCWSRRPGITARSTAILGR